MAALIFGVLIMAMEFHDIEFLDPLDGRYPLPKDIINEADWILLINFRVKWTDATGKRRMLTVPAGFKTDLSSIPKFARSIISVVGRQNHASIIHDWVYYSRVDYERVGWTRADIDLFFLLMMEECGVGWWRRTAMYRAVRVGGGKDWLDDD